MFTYTYSIICMFLFLCSIIHSSIAQSSRRVIRTKQQDTTTPTHTTTTASLDYDTTDHFSGVFVPNNKATAADFSASWLLPVYPRFLLTRANINISTNMAGVTFAVVRKDCRNCAQVLTRDYLDLFVEHLSSTTNQIPNSDPIAFQEEIQRLQLTSKLLQAPLHLKRHEDPRQNQTLAVLIFCSVQFSAPRAVKVHGDVRIPFFEVTFYSVYRYFQKVIVYVQDQKDHDIVKAMGIPVWKIVIMNVPLDIKGYATALPKYALLKLLDHIEGKDPEYQDIRYIYFTEGDQILRMRHQRELYNIIDDSDGTFVVIPHRMNTLPLRQDFSTELQKIFVGKSMDIPDVKLVIEDLYVPRGSCCEEGRYEVAPCKGWWFQCEEWGLRDMSPWFKFGNYGFTAPPSTEHRGRCVYSSHKHQCPVPPSCTLPHYPTKQALNRAILKTDVCPVDPNITYLGPLPPGVANTTNSDAASDLKSDPNSIEQAEEELQNLLKDAAKLRKRIRQRRAQLKLSSMNL